MPRAAPCTCSKRCRSRSGSVVFLGLFLLSLCLHAVTLVCYLDLRSEVRREIIHHKRDSMLTLAGSDLDDPALIPRLESGSSRGVEAPEVRASERTLMKERSGSFLAAVTCKHHAGNRWHSFTPRVGPPIPVLRCQVFASVLCYGMFLGNFISSSLSRLCCRLSFQTNTV